MKKYSEHIKFLLIGLGVFILTYFPPFVFPSRFAQGINDAASRYVYSLSRRPLKAQKFIAVGVDDYSLSRIKERYPWKRSTYARLLEALDKEKVDTVGFDFPFVGESEDKEEDRIFQDALSKSSCRVVLAYLFDSKKMAPVLPLAGLKESAYSLGMLNTPTDSDGRIRRLRAYVQVRGDVYYSFPVQLASAFLKRKSEELIRSLPLLADRTFYINYLFKPQDVIRLSFYDVLTDIGKLKREYGNDFLAGSLVIVYPEAEILHDTHATPFLGKMPGGFLHLNGACDIILGRTIREAGSLLFPFLIFSFLLVFFILKNSGFLFGALFTAGVVLADFWGLVALSLSGVKFDFSYVAIFCALYFITGSLYKYAFFQIQILRIKDKATLDPLRNLFTLRYFYYRLGLELKKIYFRRDLFLVFIGLGQFSEACEEFAFEKIKDTWQKISGAVARKGIFWSVYSPDELCGCRVSSRKRIAQEAALLKEALVALLGGENIRASVKVGYVKLSKGKFLRELLFALSEALKKGNEPVASFQEEDLLKPAEFLPAARKTGGELLDALGEDIEDKNRQLLALIDNLKKEHAKTKEAFFQIITSLVNALEARDAYTEGHSERVASYALKLAEKLGWNNEQKEKLKKAALLHDLGKIGIPDRILHKHSGLTQEEYDEIKKHEIIGVRILEPLTEFKSFLPWILYHHENWDGSGYPHGLGGSTIPEAAQIISLADVYDALTTGRDYKKAFAEADAEQELIRNKGIKFNPRLVDIFLEIIRAQALPPP